jgi:hypothetical protein
VATINRNLTLGHRANIGEDVQQIEFSEGEEITVLQEWSDHFLCRSRDGLLFNVPREAVDPD